MSPARRFVIPGFHPLRMSGMGVDRLWLGGRTVSRPYRYGAGAAFVLGGLLIIWSGLIHFHLWQAFGYRHIPTIGPLFLLQSVSGVIVGALVVLVRRVWAGIVGAGFVLSTLAGFLISVEHGLFGFKDQWSSPFTYQAFGIELSSVVVLAAGVVLCLIGAVSPVADGPPAPTPPPVSAGTVLPAVPPAVPPVPSAAVDHRGS